MRIHKSNKNNNHLLILLFSVSLLLLVLPRRCSVADAATTTSGSQKHHRDNYDHNKDDGLHWTTLSDDTKFPLVGYGVGNLPHALISDHVAAALQSDKKIRLIDTAHASKNEDLVRVGIKTGLKDAEHLNRKYDAIDVVTKVWYTHLGYERTKLSVKASLENLKQHNIRVHILIHWPRCNDEISWMNCEQEEKDLPYSVTSVGPPPHLHKETAFLESWKALEDIYLGNVKLGKSLPKIQSIGVSNFNLEDLKALEKIQRVPPKILQGNVWSFIFDPPLMDYVRENKIHFQAYNVIHGVFYDREYEDAPNAVLALNDISQQLSERNNGGNYTLPQVALKWLVQNNVSVIPRTSSLERLGDNSAVAIASVPEMDELELETVRSAVAALLAKEDLKPPMAQFINRAEEGLYSLFWLQPETGDEISIKEDLQPGEAYNAFTQRGHKFVAYFGDSKIRKELVVHAKHGQQQRFDLKGEEEFEEEL